MLRRRERLSALKLRARKLSLDISALLTHQGKQLVALRHA